MKRKLFILSLILTLIAAGCCFAWAESDNGEDAHSQSMSAEAEEPGDSTTAQEFPDVEESDAEAGEEEILPDDGSAEETTPEDTEDAEDVEEEVPGGAIPLQIPWAIIISAGVLIVILYAVISALSRRRNKDQYKGRH
ncbi:MAG: hypothetical protein IJH90_09285 [Mogibacterium sp.]|nr:hypothetical protein [Mogibacterium sp.]